MLHGQKNREHCKSAAIVIALHAVLRKALVNSLRSRALALHLLLNIKFHYVRYTVAFAFIASLGGFVAGIGCDL